MKNILIVFFVIGHFLNAQTRTWSAEEWWASLTGTEALQHIGVSPKGIPYHLRADGAITWAVINGLIPSDNPNYLDTRARVADILAKKGNSTGVCTTTSASDPRIDFYAYAWDPVTGGNTTRVNRAVFVANHSDSSKHIKELASLKGDRKVVRIARFAMEGVNQSNKNGIHPKDGGEPGSHDIVDNIALPWYDDWIERYSATLTAWATTLNNAGAELDLMILDTEVDPAKASEYGISEYNAVKADARWPELQAELQLYGYDTETSTPPSSVGTIQEAIWNSVQWNRFNRSLNDAFEAVRAIYCDVEWTDYDGRNLTGRHVAGSYYHLRLGYGTLGSVVGQYQSPSQYQFSQVYTLPWAYYSATYSDMTFGGVGDGWDGLLSDVTRLRTQTASSDTPLMPWIASKGFLPDWYTNSPPDTYWIESLYHTSLTGFTKDYIWYNVNHPQEPAALEAALIEMSNRVGYENQRPLSVEPVFYGENYVISGVDAGGKLTYRVSWNNRVITDPKNQIDWPDGTIEYDANGVGAWVTDSSGGGG